LTTSPEVPGPHAAIARLTLSAMCRAGASDKVAELLVDAARPPWCQGSASRSPTMSAAAAFLAERSTAAPPAMQPSEPHRPYRAIELTVNEYTGTV
jgi:hypothetical protein